jgi:hypothetical protein
VAVLSWVMRDSHFDAMGSGAPSGPPEWPKPGGSMRNHARLVARVDLIRSEFAYLKRSQAPQQKQPAAPAAPRRPRRR